MTSARTIRTHADRFEVVVPDAVNGGRRLIGFVTRVGFGWVATDYHRQAIGDPRVERRDAVKAVVRRFDERGY